MEQAQIANHTAFDRITAELLTVRRLLPMSAPKILSFGCSIGEEVATILTVFPEARIFACDINPHAISAASRSVGHLATVFASDEESIARHGPYDVIVASAVLCSHPSAGIRTRFPFERFDGMVRFLDSVLNPEGALVIVNASYRFRDTATARAYRSVRSDVVWTSGLVDVFTPQGEVWTQSHVFLNYVFLARGAAFAAEDDEELTDVVFQKTTAGAGSVLHLDVAPVPAGFVEQFRYERADRDIVAGSAGPEIVLRAKRYRHGTDPATGLSGVAVQVSWPSVVTEGHLHVRPEYWQPLDRSPA